MQCTIGHGCSWLQVPTEYIPSLCEESALLLISSLLAMARWSENKSWASIEHFYQYPVCAFMCEDRRCVCTEQTDRGAFGWNHEVVKRSVPWPVTCNCKFLSSCYVFQRSRSLTVYLVEEEERSPLYCWAALASFPWPGSWCWHRAVPQVLLWWMVPRWPASSRGGGSLHLPAFGWRRTCGDYPCGIWRCLHSVFITFQMEAEIFSSLIADGNGLLKWTFAVMQSTHNGMLAVTGLQ